MIEINKESFSLLFRILRNEEENSLSIRSFIPAVEITALL
jgi:hypothetical protein